MKYRWNKICFGSEFSDVLLSQEYIGEWDWS